MAGLKISELPELAYPIPSDIVVLVHSDETMQTTVQGILDILTPFTLSSFGVTPSVAPMGTTLNSVLLTWSASKAPKSISISGATPILSTDTSYVYNTPITTNTTFLLTAIGPADEVATRTATVTFSNYIYWGVSPLTTYTETDITALNKELSGTNDKDVVYDCTGGNYFVFAYPKRYGMLTSSTRVNNFPWNDWIQGEVSIANPLGFIEDYYVFRSFNLLNGNNVPVSWR